MRARLPAFDDGNGRGNSTMSTACASDCCKCARNKFECTYASTSSKNAVVLHSFCGQRAQPSARAWVGVPLPLARRDALDACACFTGMKGDGANTQYFCCPTVSGNYGYECGRILGQCDRKGSARIPDNDNSQSSSYIWSDEDQVHFVVLFLGSGSICGVVACLALAARCCKSAMVPCSWLVTWVVYSIVAFAVSCLLPVMLVLFKNRLITDLVFTACYNSLFHVFVMAVLILGWDAYKAMITMNRPDWFRQPVSTHQHRR